VAGLERLNSRVHQHYSVRPERLFGVCGVSLRLILRRTFCSPPQREAMVSLPLLKVIPVPRQPNMAIVCSKSATAYMFSLQGQVLIPTTFVGGVGGCLLIIDAYVTFTIQVVKTFEAKDEKGKPLGEFIDCAMSAQVCASRTEMCITHRMTFSMGRQYTDAVSSHCIAGQICVLCDWRRD